MAFITFRMIFPDEDELTGKKKEEETDITVNTAHICAYNEGKDHDVVMLRMSNGDVYPCPLSVEEFEDFLAQTENIIAIKEISEN
jgi:hypothetical protein